MDRADKSSTRRERVRKKKVVVFIVLALVILIMSFKVKDYYENRIWYEFAENIRKEYPIIYSIDKNDFGPHICFRVYVKEKMVEVSEAEEIFKCFMRAINDNQFLEYIQTYHNKHASGEFSSISIRFQYKNDKSNIMYEFESAGKERPYYNVFVLWSELNKDVIGKKYKLSDYK